MIPISLKRQKILALLLKKWPISETPVKLTQLSIRSLSDEVKQKLAQAKKVQREGFANV